ncbi:isochorismatase family protein [Malikia sp.]|uniref:isochorismatase family protein n=1 Tax=Malikia sp. TaxID=2070706 RepID=UPI002634B850|nr:isochorismatase family protein [Malikia sp.]MDD2728385.1 isochorismatase family protein [Malikia sp.]
MLLDADESQLLLVDYQPRLLKALHQGEEALARAVLLAQVAQILAVPAWGTEQNPAGLGETAPVLQPLLRRRFTKMAFDATQADLVEALRPPAPPQRQGGNARSLPKHLQKPQPATAAPGRNIIVLAGFEAHVCLLQTALGLLEQEFDVWVVTDACASRRERDRDAAFDRLAGNGIELVTSEMVVFEWLGDAEHPDFREVHQLIK